ncbi:MAG: hypothetical protein ACRDSJ_04240 [Rubrobacteraceae bacterium]
MTEDLIRILPAALLVGVLPGYFWAAVLFGARDLVERLAHSTALSMGLVPSAALLQTSLFGGGVTLEISIVSALAVFATGLAARLYFGAAPELTPLHSWISPPNAPALLLLTLASALLLFSTLADDPPDTYMLATALLVVFAGAVNLFGSNRAPSPETEASSSNSRLRNMVFSAAALLVFSLTLLRGYLGPALRDWPFLRGGDQYSHAVMANSMLSEGNYDSYLVYPPGFSTLTAATSRLSGLEPLEIFPVLAPALLLLPALACYALGRMLGGRWCALAAAFFAGMLLSGTYENIAGARYPNLVSAQFLLVLTIAALIRTYHSPSIRSGLLLAVLGSSVVLYHSVASFYLAMLLALISILFLPYLLLIRRRREALALFSSLALLGSLSVIHAWDTYDLPTLISGLLSGSETGAGGAGVAIAIGTQPPLSLRHLIESTSQPVLWLGVFGALLLATGWKGNTLTRTTLLLWTFLLFAGSRTALSGFPQRFERDLGMPLSALAALALISILSSFALRSPPAKSLALAAVAIISIAAAIQTGQNLEAAAKPSVTITPEAAEAGEWLAENNTGGNIISTPTLSPNVSNRAVLALGGYTGLQSYPERRARTPRSLPPSGRETIEASYWTIQNPEGERTKAILERYDIRHLLFDKSYAGWREFDARDALYRKTFENESVVIFAPRHTEPE